MDTNKHEFIEFDNVTKQSGIGKSAIYALQDVSFRVKKGEFCVVEGSMGVGLTTLIELLGGMENVTDGRIFFEDKELSLMNKKQIAEYKRHDVGFVFRMYNLVPTLTVKENVEIASQFGRNAVRASEALKMVGLYEKSKQMPLDLTDEEEQRLIIARAFAKNPKFILCDDPMADLDYDEGKNVLKLLYDISKSRNVTTLVVTENKSIGAIADRIIEIKGGKVMSEIENTEPLSVDEIEW